MAHDLTEPLRTIVSHTQMLQRQLGTHPDQKVADSIHFVVDAANRMKMFIDGLLGFSRVTHDASQIGNVDFEGMLSLALADLASAIQASGAQITHDPLPQIAAGAGFEQVFQNLIGNSIKYRREGVQPEIHISARADGESWVFSVRITELVSSLATRTQYSSPFADCTGVIFLAAGLAWLPANGSWKSTAASFGWNPSRARDRRSISGSRGFRGCR